MCTKRVHFMRGHGHPEFCADGQWRYVCLCGKIRFTVTSIVRGSVVSAA